MSSRTHFEVLGLGLGLEASSPRNFPCPRLEDSTIFEPLKFRRKTLETLRKICKDFFLVSSSRDRLQKNFWRSFSPEKNFWRPFLFEISWKKNFEDLFFFENTCVCVLGLKRVCPWPQNFFVVLGLEPCVLDSTSVNNGCWLGCALEGFWNVLQLRLTG